MCSDFASHSVFVVQADRKWLCNTAINQWLTPRKYSMNIIGPNLTHNSSF